MKDGKAPRPIISIKAKLETPEQIKDAITTACAIMDAWRLSEGFGHVSSRIPGTNYFIVTPKKGPGQVRKEELITVDFDGNIVEGEGIPFGERTMHFEIYRVRPDVGAICRFHSEHTMIMGALNRPIKPIRGTHHLLLGPAVPIFNEAGLHDNKEISQRMAKVLGDSNAIVMRGSGSITTGRVVMDACVRAVFLEQAATLQYKACLLGEPTYISTDEMQRWNEHYWQVPEYDVYMRAWNYFKSKVQREP